jgi:hypothetical protein
MPDKGKKPEVVEFNPARELKKLRSLPYTFLTADSVDATQSGVILYEPDSAWEGYNLIGTGISREVLLIDMNGRIVHKWTDPRESPGSMILPVLLSGGDLLVIQGVRGLIRLDWDSHLVWEKRLHPHHDIAFLPDSTFYILEAVVKRYRGLSVKFPTILRMTLSADVISEWSAYEHLDELRQVFDRTSFLDTVLDSLVVGDDGSRKTGKIPETFLADNAGAGQVIYDYFHANTLEILPQNASGDGDDRFRRGNILTCFRNVNQIAVLDQSTKQALWAWGEGELEWPHNPTMLANGNILVFDNGVERGYSRLLEVNPLTESIEWEYVGDPPAGFFSRTRGSCQRLPNGNTLVCESNGGRAFEITREGRIVWEWLNPDVVDGRRSQIYRVDRIDSSVIEPLLCNM